MRLFTRRCVVGIFSRESEESYEWLTERLLKFVKDVRTVYISNSLMELKHHTERCDFAILYHSKNRGRVNVADVPDSLYDKELEYLSRTFGSKNVLVVIDDVEDGSDEVKSRILSSQPSIKRWATDLILFTQDEKSSPDNESVRQKINKMEKIIRGWNTLYYGKRTYLTRVFLCLIIFLVVFMFFLMIFLVAEAWEREDGKQNHTSSTMSSITTYLTNITKATAKP